MRTPSPLRRLHRVGRIAAFETPFGGAFDRPTQIGSLGRGAGRARGARSAGSEDVFEYDIESGALIPSTIHHQIQFGLSPETEALVTKLRRPAVFAGLAAGAVITAVVLLGAYWVWQSGQTKSRKAA